VIPPEANPDLYRHEAAERTMLHAWQSGRLPPAWLLRGPRGVGKATLAYRFARRLLAGAEHERAAADPDHPVFRMVKHKAHPDLRILERVPNAKTGKLPRDIPVDDVRAADSALHATAARDGFKLLLVDPADELNPSGTNALLKLLEEPPPRTVMLLICQRPGILPRTILSRCLQVTLAPLGPAELGAALARLAPGLAPERRAVLAALAEGSPGRALELEAGDWPGRYAALLPKLAQARGSMITRLDLAAELAKGGDGRGFRTAADLLAVTVRRLAAHRAGHGPAAELFPGELPLLDPLAQGLGLDQWVAVWDKLSAVAGQVDRLNLDPDQALLQVLQAICGAAPETELSLA
jgi:DNA polymerase III subunit delta'